MDTPCLSGDFCGAITTNGSYLTQDFITCPGLTYNVVVYTRLAKFESEGCYSSVYVLLGEGTDSLYYDDAGLDWIKSELNFTAPDESATLSINAYCDGSIQGPIKIYLDQISVIALNTSATLPVAPSAVSYAVPSCTYSSPAINSDFESGSIAPWLGDTSDLDVGSQPIVVANSVDAPSYDGAFSGAITANGSYLLQSIYTCPGSLYDVNVYTRLAQSGSKECHSSVTVTSYGSTNDVKYDDAGLDWINSSFSFTATSKTTEIRLNSLCNNVEGPVMIYVDNFTVEEM
jgi:hypothetical protein